MKLLWIALAALTLNTPTLLANSIEAPGKVFYKLPAGEIVKRSVSLVIPAMGQGDVILKAGDQAVTAKKFFSKDSNGRTLFFIVFDEFPGGQEGEVAVYKGTYLRGSNLALYYGDVFIGPDVDHESWEIIELLERDHHEDFRYAAGFKFVVEID